MTAPSSLKIAAIASLKRGLEPFIHRELKHLSALGHALVLVPTKIGAGLFQPEPEWQVARRTPIAIAGGNLAALVRSPLRYLRLLSHAARHGATTDFLLACTYAREVAGADVIYATFADRKLYVGYYLKALLGIPLAVNVHAYEIYDNPNVRLFPTALTACDLVSTVTEHNREELASRFGLDPARVRVNRIAVDLEECKPRDTFAVLIVAFFSERKGHEVLFEAVKRLDDSTVEVWVVGGEGSEEYVDVKALAAKHGISDQVAFFGPLRGPALWALYRRCDVFCLPSRTSKRGVLEGFPTVIAEAMAFGKPVISTHHAEIPRIVDDEAMLVDEDDAAGLAEALRAARDDRRLLARVGLNNRTAAESLFGLGNVAATAAALQELARVARAAGVGSRHATNTDAEARRNERTA